MIRLEARKIAFSYSKHPVLRDVSFRVGEGELVGLIGANGTGKSTLLKCIMGSLRPSGGEILIEGEGAAERSRRELAQAIAYVPQQMDGGLGLSVFDVVLLGRAPYIAFRVSRKDRVIVFETLELLGLADFAGRYFGELSGGERRRVLFARALAQRSRTLVLDEPTDSLDLKNQFETLKIIRRVVKDQGLCALVAIHDITMAARFFDRLVVLKDGLVYADDAWTEVITPLMVRDVYGLDAAVSIERGVPVIVPE
jgi:iron complex transport system ATP-binding protein